MNMRLMCVALCVGIAVLVVYLWKYSLNEYCNIDVNSGFKSSVMIGNENKHYKTPLLNQMSPITTIEKSCSPATRFVYVKTHKTGSSTVQHILKKYIAKQELPKTKTEPLPFLGGYPGHILPNLTFLVLGGNLEKVDKNQPLAVFGHFRFNKTALKTVVPKDTLYISIVREPWKSFQSGFHYYFGSVSLDKNQRPNCFRFPYYHVAKGKSIGIADYIRLADKRLNPSVPWFFRSMNYQSHDLGLDPLLKDEDKIDQAVLQLGSEIDFMMITEYMDQSLILLKKLFCMEWNDILGLNVRHCSDYEPYKIERDEDAFQIFKKFHKVDTALYNYFNRTFWKKVTEFGEEDMNREVKKLRKLRDNIAENDNPSWNKPCFDQLLLEKEKSKEFVDLQYDRASMFRILQNKILLDSPSLTLKQVNAITNHMIENSGGCPT